MSITQTLARGTTDTKVITGDQGRGTPGPFDVLQVLNEEGNLVDPQRQLIHPSFNRVEGEGIFTYDYNPDITRGFVFGPARGVDTTISRTLGGSIVVQQPQFDSDVTITEIWTGEEKLSAPAEMFRRFYQFWVTPPDPGRFLTWQPADQTTVAFGVVIVSVQLGPTNEIQYREVRDLFSTREGAFMRETLTVRMQIVEGGVAPSGVITLAGL